MHIKHALTACVAGTAGLAFATGAFAQNDRVPQDKRFYVAPMVSYGFFDHDHINSDQAGDIKVDNDDSIGGTMAIGKPINEWLNLEAYGFYFHPKQHFTSNGSRAGGHADVWGVGADALLFPARDVLPVYGILGASWGKTDADHYNVGGTSLGGHADTHYLDAGVGYMYTLNDYGLKVRAEYRYRYTTVDSDDWSPNGGGATRAHFNDHIVSLGLQIPLGAPPQAKPKPQPVTTTAPKPKPVANPAPIVLKGVTFKFDSSELTAQAHHRLNNVVDALDASPDVDFRIDGYTDSTGPAQYNQGLSERRAHSVESYLTGHGINEGRITDVQGHGENNPIATNKTKAGRAQNRRVELNVTNRDNTNTNTND
jgi:OOP family OmpA-OmpF porin